MVEACRGIVGRIGSRIPAAATLRVLDAEHSEGVRKAVKPRFSPRKS